MTILQLTTIHPNPGVKWEDVQKQIKKACDLTGLRPNVGVNDDRLGSSVVMLGDGSDGFVAGDLGGVGGS
jgi:hypothetical protein